LDILIIKLGAKGDVLRTTSLLEGIHKKYPKVNLIWVTEKECFDLLKFNTLIDDIIDINHAKEKLQDNLFELIINMDEDKRAGELVRFLKKKKLIGAYSDNGDIKYTKDSEEWFGMGLLRSKEEGGLERANTLKRNNKKTYNQIWASILGLNTKPTKPILVLDEKSKNFAERFKQKKGIKKEDFVVGINTGASLRWPMKVLPIEKIIELINKLSKFTDIKIILFGGRNERNKNERIIKECDKKIIDGGSDNSLLEFASLIDLCDVLITGDTLALHIGTAFGKYIICYFGPTSHSEIELYGNGKKIIPQIRCLCCYKKECNKEPSCMEMIDIDEIVKDVLRIRRER